MNPYNLADYISNKSIKQATNLILKRLKEEVKSCNTMQIESFKNDEIETLAFIKAKKINEDCNYWLSECAHHFSATLWDSIIIDNDFCIESFNHKELTENL